MTARTHRPFLFALVLLGVVLPIALYWAWVGRAPTLDAAAARTLLADSAAAAVLVDVRTPEEYTAGHLQGAVNWPLATIRAAPALPREFQDRHLLLLCTSGFRSARAALTLAPAGFPVHSVRGGMQEWLARPAPSCPLGMALAVTSAGSPPLLTDLPYRPTSRLVQWSAVITAFGVKPFYMLLALVLILVLRHAHAPDLIALRWGLVGFLAGESFCALNYLLYNEHSYLLENLHSCGMVLAFAFTAWALMEGFDARLIRFSHPTAPCAAVPLCQRCIKQAQVPCGLRRVFLYLLVPATLILALLPLCMAFRTDAYVTTILGTPYGYFHPVAHQFYELRFLPWAGVLLLAASWLTLAVFEHHPLPTAKLLYAAALGALAFSYFRLLLLAAFADNQAWFVFWEEITELLYVLGVAAVLLIFRHALLTPRAAAA